MYVLTQKHINQINEQVQTASIHFSHLQADLTDHICCDVEARMNDGLSFESAFQKVKEEIGMEGLKRIEDETILFIHLNYVIMKKSMKVLTVLSIALIFLSSLFKISHWPGANILLICAYAAILFGFIPMLFILRNKEDIERKEVWVNLTAFLASTLFCLNIIFHLMHWPGANKLLLLTWGMVLIGFIPTFLARTLTLKKPVLVATNVGVIILIVFSILLDITITLNRKKADYLNYMVADNTITAISTHYALENKQLILMLEADSLINKQKKADMLQLTDSMHALSNKLNVFAIEIIEKNNFSRTRLKDKYPEAYEARIRELKQQTEALNADLLPFIKNDSALVEIAENMLATDKMGYTDVVDILFYQPMTVVKNNLRRISRDISLVENILLRQWLLHDN